MEFFMREMKIKDYEAVYSLWTSSEGIRIDDSDLRDHLRMYLKRNRNLCFVALHNNEIIGTIKCGHDGRRGYMHHLAIRPDFRKKGIGTALMRKCLESLKKQGIAKCNAFVLDTNKDALDWGARNGWETLEYNYRTLHIDLGK